MKTELGIPDINWSTGEPDCGEESEMADLKTKEKLRNVAMEILAEAKELVEKEIEDLPPMKLETTRIQLYETLATVTKLDREIQELMAEKDGPDIDKEILDSHKNNRDMHAMLVAIDQKLGTGSKKQELKSEVKLKKVVKPKLPKIQPRKFQWRSKNWLEFWDSFKGTIHENEDLSERDKFDYLKSLHCCCWIHANRSELQRSNQITNR